MEKNLQQIDGTLTTIEMQREALEGANTNTAVLESMKNAADALKAAHKNMYVYLFFCIITNCMSVLKNDMKNNLYSVIILMLS